MKKTIWQRFFNDNESFQEIVGLNNYAVFLVTFTLLAIMSFSIFVMGYANSTRFENKAYLNLINRLTILEAKVVSAANARATFWKRTSKSGDKIIILEAKIKGLKDAVVKLNQKTSKMITHK